MGLGWVALARGLCRLPPPSASPAEALSGRAGVLNLRLGPRVGLPNEQGGRMSHTVGSLLALAATGLGAGAQAGGDESGAETDSLWRQHMLQERALHFVPCHFLGRS